MYRRKLDWLVSGAAVLFLTLSFWYLWPSDPVRADDRAGHVTVTNVTDVAFTVTWMSDGNAVGEVEWGETGALGNTAIDDRGLGVSDDTHQWGLVAMTGLLAGAFVWRMRPGSNISRCRLRSARNQKRIAPPDACAAGAIVRPAWTDDGR